MSRLRQLLIDDYHRHYARLNPADTPARMKAAHLRQLGRTYGPIVRNLSPGSRVLDLGCGSGYLLHWLSLEPNVIPVGVDASASQVAAARQALPSIEIHCQEGLAFLRAHSGQLSAIFCTDVLEHIEEEDECLEWVRQAAQALREGGCLLCRVPNAANLTGAHSRYMDLTHCRSFTSASLLQLFQAAGFDRCAVVPYRAGCVRGTMRLAVERLVHRTLFRVCGQPGETIFTSTVSSIGYKTANGRSGN
jgi:2-polyprenyl-3-methyl-5-hydroxy-6-metoxy-1,4-benzoquinol methylase